MVGPGEGELRRTASTAIGRLAEPVRAAGRGRARSGAGRAGALRHPVLVTAGGTREPIDSVRFIGNRSSGRMGFALARAAARRGAEVTLVAANVALSAPAGVRVVEVQTAAELPPRARRGSTPPTCC